jgi:hypothetical protein
VVGVLCVLLVLGVEVVNGVLHDVARVHRLLQRRRDALQRHRATVAGSRARAVTHKVSFKMIIMIMRII